MNTLADGRRSLQICYGIIYGMGAKSLGEQMGVEENDAACYIETFKSRYRGVLLSGFFQTFDLPVTHADTCAPAFQGSTPSSKKR